MESTLKCKLRKSLEVPIEQNQQQPQNDEKSSLLVYLFGCLFGSKLFLLFFILAILALYVYYSQSNRLDEQSENSKNEVNKEEIEIDVDDKRKRKKKKTNGEEEMTKDELIKKESDEVQVRGLNTIQELNESQNEEVLGNFETNKSREDNQIVKNVSYEEQEITQNYDLTINSLLQDIVLKAYDETTPDNKEESNISEKKANEEARVEINSKPDELDQMNYEITNLLNIITVSTQGAGERAITIPDVNSGNQYENDSGDLINSNLIHQESNECLPDEDSDSDQRKSEVNIQYEHPNVLKQINISDCDAKYVEFDEKTNATLFNDNFKESLEDLTYDREEMGSRISLQTDKTIDSSIDDLSNLDKMNKQFEVIGKKSSSEGSDKFDILDKKELLSASLSNENGYEVVHKEAEETPSVTSSHNDDKSGNSNTNYHDEDDGISNRLKEQLSGNSLLSLYQAKHIHAIADNFTNLNDISLAIRGAGLDKSQLIFGIDFTISNLENGQKTFHGRSLHSYDPDLKNPYQKVIEILGKTLECFDLDGKIPAFGFGDSRTKDRKVFPFVEGSYCDGFAQVLESYNKIVKNVQLSGPTNFAPLIREAIKIVESTHQYHILVIVADGQVTNARQTRDAIVEASKHALSIIMVGVGDGPWDTMEEFDDLLPIREFDNFQFVNYHEVTQNVANPDEVFALHALMEIPDQYKTIKELGLLNFNK